MNVKREVISPDAETSPLNLASWHLVSTQPFHPQVQSVSQKPSLKIKIVRDQGSLNQPKSSWNASVVKQEVPDQKPIPLLMMRPQKRTPWYLLPSKSTDEQEPHTSDDMAPTYQKPFSKHRVANKPKQCWNFPRDIGGEIQMKLKNFKQKILKPSKRKLPPAEQTTPKSPKLQLEKESHQEDDITPSAQHTAAAPCTHLEPAVDFDEAKRARKRAEALFELRELQSKTKREGFKRPTCSKRIVKTTVQKKLIENSEISMYSSTSNQISSLCREVSRKDGESKDINFKPVFEGFKIPTIPKSIGKTSISSSSNTLFKMGFISNNHNPSQSVTKDNPLHFVEPKEIQPTLIIGGFKPPRIPKIVAKTTVSSSNNSLSKSGLNSNNQNPIQPVDFAAAREARKKAEQLVKSGSINFEVRTTAADFKPPTSLKLLNTFEEFISKKDVSFSSLSENFQDTKRTWSNYVDNIYASFAAKAKAKKAYKPNEAKNLKVSLETTIYVTATDISKKFLLTALTKFGTITAILTNSQDAACVKFYGTNAAHCACVDMNGALALGRITMQVRMAEDEDWAAMLQMNNVANAPRQNKMADPQQRTPVWFEIAAGKAQTTSHCESRELVTYSADDMIF